jgi:Flp pilus assembly protein TadB
MIYTNPDLRVSDAERSEVADRLAKHYGDGRLNQDEFNERVDQAMNAKTQSDLSGLFTDLPPLEEGPEVPAHRPRARVGHRSALFLVLLVVLAVSFGHAFWWFFMPSWLAVALLVAIGLYVVRGREAHRDRRYDRPGQP